MMQTLKRKIPLISCNDLKEVQLLFLKGQMHTVGYKLDTDLRKLTNTDVLDLINALFGTTVTSADDEAADFIDSDPQFAVLVELAYHDCARRAAMGLSRVQQLIYDNAAKSTYYHSVAARHRKHIRELHEQTQRDGIHFDNPLSRAVINDLSMSMNRARLNRIASWKSAGVQRYLNPTIS